MGTLRWPGSPLPDLDSLEDAMDAVRSAASGVRERSKDGGFNSALDDLVFDVDMSMSALAREVRTARTLEEGVMAAGLLGLPAKAGIHAEAYRDALRDVLTTRKRLDLLFDAARGMVAEKAEGLEP